MKKIRIILSVFAFVAGIGGAVASSLVMQNPVYQFIDNPGTANDECVAITLTCDKVSSAACQLSASGPVYREHDDETTGCGVELKRPN